MPDKLLVNARKHVRRREGKALWGVTLFPSLMHTRTKCILFAIIAKTSLSSTIKCCIYVYSMM